MLGIAPQLVQNMLFSEAPLLATYLPEQKALQAHIIAAFMVANVITLLYLLLQTFRPIPYDTETLHSRNVHFTCLTTILTLLDALRDLWMLLVVLAFGILASVILCVWWDVTIQLGTHLVRYVFSELTSF